MNHKKRNAFLFVFSAIVFYGGAIWSGNAFGFSTSKPPAFCARPDDSVFAPIFHNDVPEHSPKPAPGVPTTITFDDNNLTGFPDVDTFAKYEGGQSALMRDIASLLHYPENAKAHGIEGRVVLQFVIDENGNVDEHTIKVLRSAGSQLDNEAIWVIKHLRQFQPAKKEGQPVKSYFVLPIVFSLSN